MDKRYQVFISSTFLDLQEERQEVMQALLELDCIPAGMELFPAANQDQWTLIKKVIDDCDYYIVISAGRYGSLGPEGLSYTEMEYRYAREKDKPLIGFLHKNPLSLPGTRSELTDDGKAKLSEFRNLIQGKMVRFWDSPADLGSQVSRSLIKLIKTEPAVGWVKANAIPSEDATRELLALRKRVDELQRELERVQLSAPAGAEALAQGDEKFVIQVTLPAIAKSEETKITYGFEATWNEIFAAVAPTMMGESSDYQFRSTLTAFVHSFGMGVLDQDDEIKDYEENVHRWSVVDDSFQTVKVQLRALGLITKSLKPRSVKDVSSYWTLTPRGDELMVRLRAVKREIP